MIIPTIYHPAAYEWVTPDTDPFRGTLAQAIELFRRAGLATPWALNRLALQDQCRMRELRDGERIPAMTFGWNQLEQNVVAETHQWPAIASRTVLECTDGLGDALIYPLVCGNWSFEYVKPVPIYSRPEYPGWVLPPYWDQSGTPNWWYVPIPGGGVIYGSPGSVTYIPGRPEEVTPPTVTPTDEPSSVVGLLVGLLMIVLVRTWRASHQKHTSVSP